MGNEIVDIFDNVNPDEVNASPSTTPKVTEKASTTPSTPKQEDLTTTGEVEPKEEVKQEDLTTTGEEESKKESKEKTKKEESKSMSTTSKIAIGVGSTLLLGGLGGIAFYRIRLRAN